MVWRERIPEDVRAQLDELAVSAIAEYVCRRVGLTEGRHELSFVFEDGRYDRALANGRSLAEGRVGAGRTPSRTERRAP